MVASPAVSDVSSLSSVSSKELELEVMNCGDNGGGGGAEKKQRGNRGSRSGVGRVELSCTEDKFPSDSEVEVSEVSKSRSSGNSRSKRGSGRWIDNLASCQMQKSGNSGASQYGVTSRATPVMFSSDFTFIGAQGPRSVPLGGLKTATVARVCGGTMLSRTDEHHQARKRRPRLEASLRACRDFISEITSRKHKDWVWPLVRLERGKDFAFKDPIYLMDIKNKLNDRKYANSDEFEADFRKLIKNYCTAFPPDHQFHKSALRLQELFETDVKKPTEKHGNVKTTVTRPSSEGTSSAIAKLAAEQRANRESKGNRSPAVNVPVDMSQVLHSPVVPVSSISISQRAPPSWPPWTSQVSVADLRTQAIQSVVHTMVDVAKESVNQMTGNSAGQEERQAESGVEELEDKSNSAETHKEGTEGRVSSSGSSANQGYNVETYGEFRPGGGCSTPMKRTGDGGGEEQGGTEKRARVAEDQNPQDGATNPIDMSIFKHEMDWDNDQDDVEGLTSPQSTRASPLKQFGRKWLLSGISGVALQQNIMNEIKDMIGISEQEPVVDVGMLQELSDSVLKDVGIFLLNIMFEGKEHVKRRRSSDVGEHADAKRSRSSGEHPFIKLASDAITETQCEWSDMQDSLSKIHASTFCTLQHINKLQEQTFQTLNKLHERKGSLSKPD